jgi:hypothetical protein
MYCGVISFLFFFSHDNQVIQLGNALAETRQRLRDQSTKLLTSESAAVRDMLHFLSTHFPGDLQAAAANLHGV